MASVVAETGRFTLLSVLVSTALIMSMGSAQLTHADTTQLLLIGSHQGAPNPSVPLYASPIDAQKEDMNAIEQRLFSILTHHFVHDKKYPSLEIQSSLMHLARYYARYPAAHALLESIAFETWQLTYAPHTFQTTVEGSSFKISGVTVYFDPRSAAQLKFYSRCETHIPFCIVSPADALLHELLHVYAIFRDTEQFISEGGLSRHSYPITHEQRTLKRENTLYRSMTRQDRRPRPLRNEHIGRHILVSCATCLE